MKNLDQWTEAVKFDPYDMMMGAFHREIKLNILMAIDPTVNPRSPSSETPRQPSDRQALPPR